MKQCASDIAIHELQEQGWIVSHKATYRGYETSGYINSMADRQGREWCRVHTSECHGRRPRYQITVVMYRPIEKKGE